MKYHVRIYYDEKGSNVEYTTDTGKEQLKECKECIEWYKADCGYQDAPTNAVLAKIDEVLK